MNSSDNTDIRQLEDELFASMAKVPQPLAQDSQPQGLPTTAAEQFRAKLKEQYPGLTDEELDAFGA